MLFAILTLGGIGALAGLGLGIAAKKFEVKIDPKEAEVLEALPGSNCGACGFPGCSGYAVAVVTGEAEVNACTVGGEEVAKKVAAIMGVEAVIKDEVVARVLCKGGDKEARIRFTYYGVEDCKAAMLISGGNKSCAYACIGLGTCERVCPFGAIEMSPDRLPIISEELCTGCGLCANACPKSVIQMIPISNKVHVSCRSLDRGPVVKKNCDVGCIACGICVKACPFEAITMENSLAVIDYAKCTNCGLCVPVCPTKAIDDYFIKRSVALIKEGCNGCTLCKKVCPADAISGEPKEFHIVDTNRCIGCMLCAPKCPKKVIEMV